MKRAPWLDVATRELVAGVAEVPGELHNARIIEYHATTSLGASTDEVAWCSSFVNWCLRQCWIEGTGSARARSWENWGREVSSIPGALAVFWRQSRDSGKGHVGFVLGANTNQIFLLGGNQGNRVSVASYDTLRLLTCRWPVGHT